MKKSLLSLAISFLLIGFSQVFAQAELGTWKITSIVVKNPEGEVETPDAKQFREAMEGTQGTITFAKGGKLMAAYQTKGGEPVKVDVKYKIKDNKIAVDKSSVKDMNEAMNLLFIDDTVLIVQGNKATLVMAIPDKDAGVTTNLEKVK
jgi:hypothetical protein